jgi:hypothetical protein
MHGEDHAGDFHAIDQILDQRAEFLGGGVADGVGDVQRVGPGLGHGGVEVDQVVAVAAGHVLGGELDVVGVGAGQFDGLDGAPDVLLAGDLEHVLQVDVGAGAEGVDATQLAAAGFDGLAGADDVDVLGAGQGADLRALDLGGDGQDGLEVSGRGDGEAGLDDVDLQARQLAGDTELLVQAHGGAGALLAVAQGGVEDQYAVFFVSVHVRLSGCCRRDGPLATSANKKPTGRRWVSWLVFRRITACTARPPPREGAEVEAGWQARECGTCGSAYGGGREKSSGQQARMTGESEMNAGNRRSMLSQETGETNPLRPHTPPPGHSPIDEGHARSSTWGRPAS